MMYEEQVKRLRDKASKLDYDGWVDTAASLEEAADTIEALEFTCDIYEKDYKALQAYVPKWIPVTEGLPKTQESILGKKSNKVIVAFRFDDGTQGTDTAHTLNGEWVFEDHITAVERTITHWQPLPEPQKEEV